MIGTVALIVALPEGEIGVMEGVAQAFFAMDEAFGIRGGSRSSGPGSCEWGGAADRCGPGAVPARARRAAGTLIQRGSMPATRSLRAASAGSAPSATAHCSSATQSIDELLATSRACSIDWASRQW